MKTHYTSLCVLSLWQQLLFQLACSGAIKLHLQQQHDTLTGGLQQQHDTLAGGLSVAAGHHEPWVRVCAYL